MRAAIIESYEPPPTADEFREPDGEGDVLDVIVAGMNPVGPEGRAAPQDRDPALSRIGA